MCVRVCEWSCTVSRVSVNSPLNRWISGSRPLSASTLSFYANAAVYCPEHVMLLSGPALTDRSLTASMCVWVHTLLLLLVGGHGNWPAPSVNTHTHTHSRLYTPSIILILIVTGLNKPLLAPLNTCDLVCSHVICVNTTAESTATSQGHNLCQMFSYDLPE